MEWHFECLLFYFATVYSAFFRFYNQDPNKNDNDVKRGKK